MIKLKDLTQRTDQNIWISDDRISALIAHSCQGIEQIDYHGAQPVSRNAKLLQHPDGVLKFEVLIESNGAQTTIPLNWSNLMIQPGIIQARNRCDDFSFTLKIAVLQDTLLASCTARKTGSSASIENLEFSLWWNKLSMTTEVHGKRSWAKPEMATENSIILQATDVIELSQWLKRTGDYQGDFLIPEGWRRIIFNKRLISGMAKFEDVKSEYKNLNLKLYVADTWILIGGDHYFRSDEKINWLQFKARFIQTSKQLFEAPLFRVQFSQQKFDLPKISNEVKKPFYRQSKRYRALAESAPQLNLPGYPATEEFFSQTPLIVESAKVQDAGMTRACPGTYYWIWAWDNLVTAPAMLRWGDRAFVQRMANFINSHRDIDGAIPGRWTRQFEPMDSRGIGAMDFLFSELVLSLFAETKDAMIIRSNYTALAHAFHFLKSRCDENGLFPSFGMYPDLPYKMGRTENFYVAIDQGAWYCLCRNLEKMAFQIGDIPTANQAKVMASKIEKSFLPTFWDAERGFICDSFDPVKKNRLQSFPIFSLLFLESPFGSQLLKNQVEKAADFIELHLLGDNGMKMTPAWDRNHNSEPAMSGWYPHWDLPAIKLLARAGKWSAIQKWLNLVEECYVQLGYCPEFLSTKYQRPELWHHHGAAWNLNCAAGWYQALLHSIIGIAFDPGGITCHPAPLIPEASLKKLIFRNNSWEIQKSGQGDFISWLEIDGEKLAGSLKIPAKFYTDGEHRLIIHYQSAEPDDPILKELIKAELLETQVGKTENRYLIQGLGTTDVSFSSHEKPIVMLDGNPLAFHWSEAQRTGNLKLILNGKHQFTIQRR
ncbi:MAG: hypothetical protein MUC94_10405 [bacterium]|nr:hypothetical protein [bacterium]